MVKQEVLQKKAGHWVTVGIQTHISWPTEVSIYQFRNYDLLLKPGDNTTYPSISLKYDDYHIDMNTARKVIMHFASSLVWYEDSPVHLKGWIGGSHCFNPGKPGTGTESPKAITSLFPIKTLGVRELPDTLDKNVRAALAFYREGLELDNIPYKFLSFYKIINLFVGRNGSLGKQVEWINNNLLSLTQGSDAQKRVDKLCETCNDIGKYLYASCRCAVAHADAGQAFVDPEDIDELTRLEADLPLIRALAQIVIENEYSIKSGMTIFKEHLYELNGFKLILGDKLVQRIVNGDEIDSSEIPVLPKLSICLAHNQKFVDSMSFSAFEVLQPKVLDVANSVIRLECSKIPLVSVVVGLDFKNERILFDPCNCFSSFKDDLSPKVAEYAMDFNEFLKVYYSNGILELWNADSGELLGYTDPFVPCNIDSTRTFANFDKNIAHWKAELESRSSSNEKRGNRNG